MSQLQSAFEVMSFQWPFRRYQQLALEAYENRQPVHQHRCYLVMPPGSGKTALGLEIIRREGNPAVVFCPNTAVQQQWSTQWSDFQPSTVSATVGPDLDAPLAFLTYQSLCNLGAEHEDLDDLSRDLWVETIRRERGLSANDANAEVERLRDSNYSEYRRELGQHRSRARRMIARGDDPERLLDLLHPNGQELVERLRALPACTLVLDECHHLLEMWGYLVRALVDVLSENVLVVGLTATPPRELNPRESELYRALFGYADFEVPTPAVVKEGDLAPYQELGYLTEPLAREREYVAEQHIRFEELITDLLGHDFASRPFLDWVQTRVSERHAGSGAAVSWARFERDNPDLAQAALRLYHRFDFPPPPGVRIREPHRLPLSADDWVTLIEDFCLGFLRYSEGDRDRRAWETIRSSLPSLGYVLTRRGIRKHASPVDRVLSLSASKGLAASNILSVEHGELGDQLRALVLCDYERTNSDLVAELRGVLDDQAGSAILLLEQLLVDSDAARLNPILMTGRTVACSLTTANDLSQWLAERQSEVADSLVLEPMPSAGRAESSRLVAIGGPSKTWRSRYYVGWITQFFEEGYCQCLVGTRGLLGEGWDAKRVNVLIDLTTASTATSVHQMRGRSIRLDPSMPEKVANNWDVVCVDPRHPKGTADYERFVRKHRHYFAPTRQGEIESGVSHVHHALSPFGPPDPDEIPEINRLLLRRATERHVALERWRIGEPYENQEIHTVRIRPERSMGLPNRRVLREDEPGATRRALIRRGAAVAGLTGLIASGVAMVGADPTAFLMPLGVAGTGAWWAGQPLRDVMKRLTSSDNLEDFAMAVMEGLQGIGELPEHLTARNLALVIQDDGYYRCYLTGVSGEQSRIFATSLDELLAPLSNPRYIVPRYIAEPPRSVGDAALVALRLRLRGRAGSTVVYHAVPEPLARNRERVSAFEHAWQRHVSPGQALFYQHADAHAIIAAQGGENPFDITTQMRVLWR